MRRLLLLAFLLLLAALNCEARATGGTLSDSFLDKLRQVRTITRFEIKKNTMSFYSAGDEFTAKVTSARVDPNSDTEYPFVGRIECEFTMNGQPIESFDGLAMVDIDPRNIVALWNAKEKKWVWSVEMQQEY